MSHTGGKCEGYSLIRINNHPPCQEEKYKTTFRAFSIEIDERLTDE